MVQHQEIETEVFISQVLRLLALNSFMFWTLAVSNVVQLKQNQETAYTVTRRSTAHTHAVEENGEGMGTENGERMVKDIERKKDKKCKYVNISDM